MSMPVDREVRAFFIGILVGAGCMALWLIALYVARVV